MKLIGIKSIQVLLIVQLREYFIDKFHLYKFNVKYKIVDCIK